MSFGGLGSPDVNIHNADSGTGIRPEASSISVALATEHLAILQQIETNTAAPIASPIQLKNISGSTINPATNDTLLAIESLFPTSLTISGNLKVAVIESLPAGTNLIGSFKLTDGARTANITAGGAVQTDGSGTTQPVSISSLPLPLGAASEATLASIRADTDKFVFVASRLIVDGSGVTQPISAVSLPLPTGAGTESTLLDIRTDLGQFGFASSRLIVDGSQVSQPVKLSDGAGNPISSASGAVDSNITKVSGASITLGQKTSASSIPVVLPSDQTITVGSITAGTIEVTIPPTLSIGTIASALDTVELELAGRIGIAVLLEGTWSASLVGQISTDNASTWHSVPLFSVTLGTAIVGASTVSGNGTYHFGGLAGVTHVRIFPVSYSSGTVNITITATAASSLVTESLVALDQQSPTVAGFGRLRVAEPFSLFESALTDGDSGNLIWNTVTSNGGTTTYLPNESSLTLNITTTSGSSTLRRSKQYFRYQPGKSQVILQTGIIGPSVTNLVSRIGYYDNQNGIFFQQSSSGLSVVRRTFTSGTTVDNVVAQASWNVDKLDGTGPSGVSIDPTMANIFYIELEWLGAGLVRTGFSINGTIYIAHVFRNSNSITTPYMTTGSLPCSYEIFNTGILGTPASIKQICATVHSEGGQPDNRYFFSASSSITPADITTTSSPIIMIRPKLLFNSVTNRGSVFPQDVVIYPISSQPIQYDIILNPTITGSPIWISADTNSAVEYSVTAGLTSTGGTRINSGYAEPKSVKNVSYESTLPLTIDSSASTQDVLAVVATSFTGVTPVVSSIDWREVR